MVTDEEAFESCRRPDRCTLPGLSAGRCRRSAS